MAVPASTQGSFLPPAPTGDRPKGIQREVAHRAFALEFNGSRHEIKGQGEKDPSFIVTPLGAKVNRVHVVGVCTDVEPVGESGEVWRARISDPSGVFSVYAGNYQPEAAAAIAALEGKTPAFVAVTGKARTYEPEPGSVFVSIRPETVTVVDEATRDQWLLDTARRTQERLAAVAAVRLEPQAGLDALVARGIAKPIAEGALLAQQHYGLMDTERYAHAVKQCVSPLLPGGSVPVVRLEKREGGFSPMGTADRFSASSPPPAQAEPVMPTWRPPVAAPKPDAAAEAATEALDGAVLAHVQKLEGAKGARWDDILQASAVAGVTAEDVEESLNRLMDKGLVYEPTLGILKTT
jgi:RPA family protein